jgi:hypothetical protein
VVLPPPLSFAVDMTSAVKRWLAVVFHLLYPLDLGHRKRRSQYDATVDPAAIRGLGTTLLASVGCRPHSRREGACRSRNAVEGCTPPGLRRFRTSVVLRALTNEWCRMMSLSFDDVDRTQRDLQVGELDARMNSKGYVFCPFCHKTFSPRSSSSWDGSRHLTCGVRLRLVPAESSST